jgi:hypothetical protein
VASWLRAGRLRAVKGKRLFCVNVRFDALLDPEHAIFPRARLKAGLFAKMHWEPQGSGISIPEDVAAMLEEEWADFKKQPFERKDFGWGRCLGVK